MNKEERFESKINKTSSCWLWTGAKYNQGYGQFPYGKKAHRFSYELYKGPIPKGMLVCHTCDVRICVNPDHLFLGTYADNNHDRDNKGRTYIPKGEFHGRHKLTKIQVEEIKNKYIPQTKQGKADGYSMNKIAKEYSIDASQVANILKNKHWRD